LPPRHPRAKLFPYTTLFRSNSAGNSNAGNTGNSGASQYVAPYQGQNAVPVAQNITSGSTDAQTALQSLPNFKNALDNATAEVNRSEEHTSELQSRFDLVCRL